MPNLDLQLEASLSFESISQVMPFLLKNLLVVFPVNIRGFTILAVAASLRDLCTYLFSFLSSLHPHLRDARASTLLFFLPGMLFSGTVR